mmetsp:Transcript_42496/g.86861  ORF Transcript_42496/g.86861 Transcript_42496/m.86861 type:complete len:134 (-) Transcript_42496:1-402(-)
MPPKKQLEPAKREVVADINILALRELLEGLGVEDVDVEMRKLKPRRASVNNRISTRARMLYVSMRLKTDAFAGEKSVQRRQKFHLEFKNLSDEEKWKWMREAMATVDEDGYVLKAQRDGAKEEEEDEEAGAKE